MFSRRTEDLRASGRKDPDTSVQNIIRQLIESLQNPIPDPLGIPRLERRHESFAAHLIVEGFQIVVARYYDRPSREFFRREYGTGRLGHAYNVVPDDPQVQRTLVD